MSNSRIFVLCCSLVFCSQPSPAQSLLGAGIEELSKQIAAAAALEQKRRIAVVGFRELDGSSSVLGAYLAESLTTRLFQARRFEIVERTLLDKVMLEMKLGATGALDPSTVARIGKLAGVDAIVTGTVTDMPSSVAVNSRIIDVVTAKVFGAAEVRIVKDDDLRAIMSKPYGRESVGPSGSGSERPIQATVQGVDFTVDRCSRRGTAVACRFWITNTRSDTTFFIGTGVGVVRASFWDDAGNQYQASRIVVANQEMTPLGVRLISGLKTQATFEIEGNVPGRALSRIAFSASTAEAGFFSVTLNSVPIQ